MEDTKPFSGRVTELEDRLASWEGAALRLRLVAELKATESRLAATLAAMVPRAEFPAFDASIEAVRAAQSVLEAWVPGTAMYPGTSVLLHTVTS